MATNLSALAEALSAIETGVAKPVQAERLSYAEARADLEARARDGKTIQGRNSKGHFTRGVKMFTAGVAPVAQAPAKVEKRAEVTRRPVTVERDRRASVVVSAEA